jgi:hypothetical protein
VADTPGCNPSKKEKVIASEELTDTDLSQIRVAIHLRKRRSLQE